MTASSEQTPESAPTVEQGVWPLLAELPSLPLPNLRKGWAKGARATFLKQCVVRLREKKGLNPKRAAEFTNTTAINEYFREFFWALPLHQDPHNDDPPPVADKELSNTQHGAKVAIVKQMSNAIPKWLEYHVGKVTTVAAMTKKARERDPILAFLSCLAGTEPLRYRSLTPKQWFGKDNNDLSLCFDAFWNAQGGLGKDRAAARAAFVAAEFDKLSSNDQDRWGAFAERMAAENKRPKGGAWAAPALLPPADVQRVWDMLASTLQPLIKGLSVMLGSHVSLAIMGPEPRRGGQVNVIIIHEGLNKSAVPLHFHEVGGEPYRLWLAAIGEFALSCYTPEEQRARALPGVAQPSGPPPFWMSNAPWRLSTQLTVRLGPAVVDEEEESDPSEIDSGSEGKKQKKKKKTSKKRARKSSATEEGEGTRISKRSKAMNTVTVTRASSGQPPLPSIRMSAASVSAHEDLSDITNTVTMIHPVTDDDANTIDPSLLATGLYPGSLIPNCGPNDCPNPFTPHSAAASRNTSIERFVEASPTARSPYPAWLPLPEAPIDRTPPAKVATNHTESWPPWFTEARTYLGRFNLGPEWDRLSGKPLKQTFRPSQVSLWIQNACSQDPTPLDDRDAFVAAWWLWWRDVQPKSRGLAGGEGPVPASMRLDDGDWEDMRWPGQNGLYSVVAALSWWGESIHQSPVAQKEWLLAVDDTCWAFGRVAAV
ncbi:hypothetical protein EDD18DRAFT_1115981 [Armillaria luteobubalina]|uniref:Uncharacterized protein n=1 Tax=Armillaria luteobubalina TaxID=153913 RepID=A0AA39P1V0_9AGAR|nr:hypothetical protein EDD18DRAFT_1115981 [Armillaria luteobubalina]